MIAADVISGARHGSAGVWDYVSASRLNLWLKCPLAFKLRYIDGIVTPPSPAMFVGRMVHRGLEYLYRCRQLECGIGVAELARHVAETWDVAAAAEQVRFESLANELACQRQAIDLVSAYSQQLSRDEPRVLAVEVVHEAPLVDPETGEDVGIPLVGVIDLVLEGEAGPLIVDFKTAARATPPLEISHEIQIGAYAYLLRRSMKKCEAGVEIRQLVKSRVPQIHFYRYKSRSDVHFRRLFAVIRAYLQDLRQQRHVFRPSLSCQLCEYRETHCGSWCG